MARKRFVTRAITVQNVEYLGVDKTTKETFTAMEEVSGTFSDEKKVLKAVKEKVDTEDITAVAVLNSEEKTQYYIMPEEEFIKYAQKSETRFPVKAGKVNTNEVEKEEVNKNV